MTGQKGGLKGGNGGFEWLCPQCGQKLKMRHWPRGKDERLWSERST